ncbi:tyrosine-type recombinase/integrase [Oceanispirochaeta crateris]|uniref:tyrosine-type recombinase/integrase n=1 Tax=Oceanispirochaeta crateris TaxID=2518645 RepID=UPI00143D2A47|nr:site-specific integrase [Oceanispirochaeta crateris]
MRYREPFTVYPRKMRSGKVIWYYQTYDDSGKRTSAYSTGQTSKSAARHICQKLLREGKLLPDTVGRITFRDYAKNWWDWDKCEYLKYKRTRRNISKSYASTGRLILKNHIMPYFKDMRLADIRIYDIEQWLQSLVDSGQSNTSANHYLRFLRIMMTEAIRRDILKEDVSRKVLQLKKTEFTRGILSHETVRKIFDQSNIMEYWPNKKCYYASLIAACTGMRIGEVRGLKYSDLGIGIVSISRQYHAKFGVTDTKNHKSREVPLPQSLIDELLNLDRRSDEDYILASTHNHGDPMHPTSISRAFTTALVKSGMKAEEIKAKNITFHSWRHYFNTVMRSNNISDSKLRSMTGHQSSVMTDHYTHYAAEDLKEIGDVQSKILSFHKVV